MILDIGPKLRPAGGADRKAGTIVWNGPVGVFEFDQFAEGTKTLAMAIAIRRRSRSQAVATPWPRSPSTRSPTRSVISRPAAAPSSSSSKVRRCRQWRSCCSAAPNKSTGETAQPRAALFNLKRITMYRGTKIVATIGPASTDSTCSSDDSRRRRRRAPEFLAWQGAGPHRPRHPGAPRRRRCGREVAIMADMQGPKIRVGKFEEGKIVLNNGDPFILDADGARTASWATRNASASTTRRCRATSSRATSCC